jgi:HlyD family secretion protein
MTANVTFVYAERKGVLRIPSAALRFRPPAELLALTGTAGQGGGAADTPASDGHKKKKKKGEGPTAGPVAAPTADGPPRRTVWVLQGDRPVEVPVTVGVADGSRVELTGGQVQEGDVLVTDAISKTERAEAKKKGLF